MASLSEILNQLTKAGSLYLQEEATTVRCVACAHRCRIQEGKHGICQMRTNQNGVLKVPWGYVSSAQIDPIEKDRKSTRLNSSH